MNVRTLSKTDRLSLKEQRITERTWLLRQVSDQIRREVKFELRSKSEANNFIMLVELRPKGELLCHIYEKGKGLATRFDATVKDLLPRKMFWMETQIVGAGERRRHGWRRLTKTREFGYYYTDRKHVTLILQCPALKRADLHQIFNV